MQPEPDAMSAPDKEVEEEKKSEDSADDDGFLNMPDPVDEPKPKLSPR